jgi:hypothetical protein
MVGRDGGVTFGGVRGVGGEERVAVDPPASRVATRRTSCGASNQ